jgi:hypothetical protein
MSTNITTWKTKELLDFKITISDLYTHNRKDFHPDKPEIVNFENNEVNINLGTGNGEIKGILEKSILTVNELPLC